ncbi:MAG: hypothetical protein ACW963_02560 [Candidatus Sifarchaeia archaeon]|jgi:hypothetical protein
MIAQIVLTPWESKRLIAKGTVQLDSVKNALRDGIVAIARGTTDAYVFEELLGNPVDKENFVAGAIAPDRLCLIDFSKIISEVAFVRGELREIKTNEIVKEMKAGDVFIKGGNAVDLFYNSGILIGADHGGTIGNSIGQIIAKGIELVCPVGLEKLIMTPVDEVSALAGITRVNYSTGMPCGLFAVTTGTTITEIQALELLTDEDIEVIHMASGGVIGAEGSVVLQISGDDSGVNELIEIVKQIKGEPPLKVPVRTCPTCDWLTCAWTGQERPY